MMNSPILRVMKEMKNRIKNNLIRLTGVALFFGLLTLATQLNAQVEARSM